VGHKLHRQVGTYAYMIYTLTEYYCMYNCNIVTKLADECINTQSAIYLYVSGSLCVNVQQGSIICMKK